MEIIRQFQDQFIEQRDFACSDFLSSNVILGGLSDLALVFNQLPVAAITGSVAKILDFSHNYFCKQLDFKQTILNTFSSFDLLRTAVLITRMRFLPISERMQIGFSAVCLAAHLTANLFMGSSVPVVDEKAPDKYQFKYAKVYELFYQVFGSFLEHNKTMDLKSVSILWQKYLSALEQTDSLRQRLLKKYAEVVSNPINLNQINKQIFRLATLFSESIEQLFYINSELLVTIDKLKYYLLSLVNAKKIISPTVVGWSLLMTEIQSLTLNFSNKYKKNSFYLDLAGKNIVDLKALLQELGAYKQLMDYVQTRLDKHPNLVPGCFFTSNQDSKQNDNCEPHFTFVNHQGVKNQLDNFLNSNNFLQKELKKENAFLELFKTLDVHRGYIKLLQVLEEKKANFPLLPDEIEIVRIFKEIIPQVGVLRQDFTGVLKKAYDLASDSYSNLNQITQSYFSNENKMIGKESKDLMKNIRTNLTELSKLYADPYFSTLSKLLTDTTLNRLLYILSEKEYLESVRLNGYELQVLNTGIESLKFHLDELIDVAFNKHLHS